MEASSAILPTSERLTGGRHRPPRLYRYNDSVALSDNGPLDSYYPHEKEHR
jgi:hypothetical protein